MAYGYLLLAVIVAATLSSGNRLLRSAGMIVVAAGLTMIAASIVLANLDGTFAVHAAQATVSEAWTPTILNLQAGLALVTVPFLIWQHGFNGEGALSKRRVPGMVQRGSGRYPACCIGRRRP